MSYTPNASQLTEPVESRAVQTAALEFRTIKSKLTRTLRFPASDTAGSQAELPAANARAGRLLVFDPVTGQPVAGPITSDLAAVVATEAATSATASQNAAANSATAAAGSATSAANSADNASASAASADALILREDLASNAVGNGAALVGFDGGTVQTVLDDAKPMQSYTALRAYTGRATGVRITTPGIAGHFFRDASDTTSADDGGTIIVDASGRRWKRLFVGAVNVIWFGVQYTATYDEAIAKSNRTKIEALLRDTTKAFVVFPADPNPLYICGSIHPLRGNLTIWQQAGCNIIGYEQNSDVIAGHLFGFVMYQNPDAGQWALSGEIKNITYILDGDIQTAFSASNFSGVGGGGLAYNHNAFGFYDCVNCQVVGTGGISKCNHSGINFDGLADNCHVDINYVKDCSTINIAMKGRATSFNTVKAKYVYNDLFDDTVNQPNGRCCVLVGGNKALVDIGYIKSTKAFPVINLQTVTEHAQISLGAVDGNGSHLVRMYATKALTLSRALYSNLANIVTIAGVGGDEGIFKNIVLENVICTDTTAVNTTRIVDVERTPSAFDRLVIRNCDFGLSTGLTNLMDNLNPGYFDISNTKLPSTYNYTSTLGPRIKSKNLATFNLANFTFNSNDIYGVIRKVHFQVIVTSVADPMYLATVDLTTLGQSSTATYRININSTVGDVTITWSGTTYTFTAPTGYRFSYAEGEYV